MKWSLIGIIAFLTACTHPTTKEGKMNWLVEQVQRKLDLTESQNEKFKLLAQSLSAHEKTDHKAEFKKFFNTDEFDEAKARAYLKEEQEKFSKSLDRLLPEVTMFYNSLNKDQKTKFMKLYSSHSSRRRRSWHKN